MFAGCMSWCSRAGPASNTLPPSLTLTLTLPAASSGPGTLLVVDAAQGVQAQTLANFYLAFEKEVRAALPLPLHPLLDGFTFGPVAAASSPLSPSSTRSTSLPHRWSAP